MDDLTTVRGGVTNTATGHGRATTERAPTMRVIRLTARAVAASPAHAPRAET